MDIYGTWPWYVSGPLIALIMFLLLMMGKRFGMSSNLRTLCTICGAGKKHSFFDIDWKDYRWNLVVALGVLIGGFVASNYLTKENTVVLEENVSEKLQGLGFESVNQNYLPEELFGAEAMSDPFVIVILIIAGLLIGFGSRYAGGCTSGHAISGLSALQLPSLIAVIGFFIGGLVMVHLIFPLIF
ncbi:MAG: YeeE/YedE family protein [Flavobacteriales bacterium]|nr:YeeE/YedE family protein [Flavobacteriales bacterium]